MLKRVSIFTLLVIMLVSVISINEASAQKFSDVNSGAKEIEYLVKEGIITGYPGGQFRPDKQVSRAEAATMIGRAKGLQDDVTTTIFPDVSSNYFAAGFIKSAHTAGIITGYPDGSYRPTNGITREEMATVLSRAFTFGNKQEVYYNDVAKDSSYYEAINLITAGGISNGYPGQVFKPKNTITRAEFSVMVARAMDESYRVKYENKPIKQFVITETGTLNVRSGPGVSNGIVGTLARDKEVLVHYKANASWVYITSGTLKGFVNQTYLADQKLAVKPPAPPKPPKTSRVVAIDAGHGGSDPGASGHNLVEKEINLNVSKRVQKKLEAKGIKVVMTRTDDRFIKLGDRAPIAVRGGADTFVSIHTNSFGSSAASGTETFYSTASLNARSSDSKKLAEFIQKRLVVALKTTNRGVKTAGFQVIKHNPLPATLVELGFITNKSDAAKLASESYRNLAAGAIAQGIIDYYEWKGK